MSIRTVEKSVRLKRFVMVTFILPLTHFLLTYLKKSNSFWMMTKVSIILLFTCIIMTINGTEFFKLTLLDFCIFALVFTVVYLLVFFIIKKIESYIQRNNWKMILNY